MGVEQAHATSNYYLIAGLLVIIGILVLVAICIGIMNLRRLINICRKSETVDGRNESAASTPSELQEYVPLAKDSDVPRIILTENNFSPPTYTDAVSTSV